MSVFQANYSLENSEALINDAEILRESVTGALEKVSQVGENVAAVIDDINELSNTLSAGKGTFLRFINLFQLQLILKIRSSD